MKGRYLFSFVFGAVMLGSFSWDIDVKRIFTIDPTDNIELSTKEASLSAENDSAIFLTKGTCWWINQVVIDGKPVDFKVADSQKDNFKMKNDWVTIERQGRQKLVVKTDDNMFLSARNVKVFLEVGGYIDSIDIKQEGVGIQYAQVIDSN